MLLTGAKGGRKRERMAAGGRTALLWDTVSCPLPSSSDPSMVSAMAPALLSRFSIINVQAVGGVGNSHDHFSAYQFFSETETELDQTLINCGIRLQQTPPADVLLWAMNTPPPGNVIFIVGHMDLSYLFEKLRQRSYNVYLVSSSSLLVPQGVLKAANDYMGWFSFLRSLDDEIQKLHFHRDHGFYNLSNAALSLLLEETHNRSVFYNGLEYSFRLPIFRCRWNSPLSNEAGRSFVQPDPGFDGHYITTEKSKMPPLLPSSTEESKTPPLLPSTTEENPR